MKTFFLLTMTCVAMASPVWALSTDRAQPIEVSADKFAGDEVKQTATYSGHVVVRQGSIELKGAHLELAITPKGYRHIELTGQVATFSQARDPKTPGVKEKIHAQAQRIVYDEATDTIRLTGKAALFRTENGVEKDSTRGEAITYNLRTGSSEIKGGLVNGQPQRVTTIIAPRQSPAKTESAPTSKE